jgi:hypothetical protein
MNARILNIWFVLILLSSCNSLDQFEHYTTSNDTMSINLKQVCKNEKYNIKLQFDSILNDSRCPEGALCLWEGNAQVQFYLIDNHLKHHKFDLNTNSFFRQDTIIQGINYKLVSLLPLPKLENLTNPQHLYVIVVANKP